MSNNYLIRMEACPRCRKEGYDQTGDNLAIYSDEHRHCYRCGYHIPAKVTIETVVSSTQSFENVRPTSKTCDNLPSDITSDLSLVAKRWLLKYGLTFEEAKKFWWSDSKQFLIFPACDVEGNLLFWQARDFNDKAKSKYFSTGNIQDSLYILGKNEPLILVEDIISAIKISRHYKSMALFGSSISNLNLTRIRDYILSESKELGIWLDPDKIKDAVKISNRAKTLGINSFFIISKQDPKDYQDNEIIDLISHWRKPSDN